MKTYLVVDKSWVLFSLLSEYHIRCDKKSAMRRNQPTQHPNHDYPHTGPGYPSNETAFTNPSMDLPLNAAPWPDLADTVQQSAPQTATRPSRAASGGEHTKHRRTRSGCFTCRQRRVKCDEARPVCDRCFKGSRECTYPEPRSSTKTKGSKPNQAHASTTIDEESDSDEEGEDGKKIASPNVGHNVAGKASRPEPRARKTSRSKGAASWKHDNQSYEKPIPSIEQDKKDLNASHSPETDGLSPLSASQCGSRSSQHLDNLTSDSSMSPEKISLSHLPQDQSYYLEYLQTNITHHHYFFRIDANYFIHNILVECALSYEPLLYAVVGFAAFHATLRKSDGKIQDFLVYYNRSVSLLRKSLASGQTHTDATLLTILQLASFEEYLGDWVNLLGHHRAAYSMLTELHTVESIMETEVRRKILAWYSRFDLFLGFMSGYKTVLGREWFAATEQYYVAQAEQRPGDINPQIEAAVASHRVLAMDMALLFAKLPSGAISFPEFSRENVLLAQRIRDWKQSLEPLLSDDRYLVTSFENASQREKDDIVDPYRPGGLFQGPLSQLNFLMMDWLGTNILHTYQTALIMKQAVPAGLVDSALEVCRLFETVEYWPESAPGSVLSAQAGLGIAALFLPKDERHTMWIRRKLAVIESNGYTYPPTLRDKMATLWDDPGIHRWWLPNEEGCPAIIRSIRDFTEERSSKTGGQPISEDIRNMKGLLEKLNIQSPKDQRFETE
ncbi:MAG: hypothetical protein Q9216_005421 [Gyalolechia sp. 2 TL-2023]